MPTVIVPDVTVTLAHRMCPNCGVHWAVDERWEQRRRNDHKTFWCPNGCSLSFSGPTKAEKEADELRRLWNNERSYAASVAERLESEKKAHSATKGQLTKTRKRAASALCPVCSRSFKQVRQHLTRMHPDFVDPGAVEKHTHP